MTIGDLNATPLAAAVLELFHARYVKAATLSKTEADENAAEWPSLLEAARATAADAPGGKLSEAEALELIHEHYDLDDHTLASLHADARAVIWPPAPAANDDDDGIG